MTACEVCDARICQQCGAEDIELGWAHLCRPCFECQHWSATGVDQATGPDKVWRCDGCGWLHRYVTDESGFTELVSLERQTDQ